MTHSLIIARVKDFPDAEKLKRALVWPLDYETIGDFGTWEQTGRNMKDDNAEYHHFELPDKNGDIWEKTSAHFDYCILGGKWIDEDHPCVDTYKNILNYYPDSCENFAVLKDFNLKNLSFPKQQTLWADDDLMYVMDTHR